MEGPVCPLPDEEADGEYVEEDAQGAHPQHQHPLHHVAEHLEQEILGAHLQHQHPLHQVAEHLEQEILGAHPSISTPSTT